MFINAAELSVFVCGETSANVVERCSFTCRSHEKMKAENNLGMEFFAFFVNKVDALTINSRSDRIQLHTERRLKSLKSD